MTISISILSSVRLPEQIVELCNQFLARCVAAASGPAREIDGVHVNESKRQRDLVQSDRKQLVALERMRGLGVLYDRNANGEFFHIYSETFADRFFFEIVQRVGGYEGFGALNAPARMASQAQALAEEEG